MKWIERAFIAHLLIVVGAIGFGLIQSGVWIAALVTLLLGGVWYAANTTGKRGAETLFLLLTAFVTATSFYFSFLPVWAAVLAMTAALGAWDLDFFLQRLRQADRLDNDSALGSSHLQRLIFTEAVGLFFGLVAINLRIQISFWWTMLLLLFVIIGISRLIRYLKDEVG